MTEVEIPASGTAADAVRGRLWLPLLQRITLISPLSVVWKNASATLEGRGDLDVIAPTRDWKRIEAEFRRWAGAARLEPVVVCRHVPGAMFLLAADPERPAFFELDVKARGSYRGVTVFRGADLLQLSELDSRGFRRLRPGAEGLLKLILNGTADDGNLNSRRVQRERIVELLQSDPDGVQRAAQLFGGARTEVLELARAVQRGAWNRDAMLRLRARFRLALVLEPVHVSRRLWSRVAPRRACRGIKTLINEGRLAPGDHAGLQAAARGHAARGAVA